jgi:hypothetical protein
MYLFIISILTLRSKFHAFITRPMFKIRHVYMNFDHKDLGGHLLHLHSQLMEHPAASRTSVYLSYRIYWIRHRNISIWGWGRGRYSWVQNIITDSKENSAHHSSRMKPHTVLPALKHKNSLNRRLIFRTWHDITKILYINQKSTICHKIWTQIWQMMMHCEKSVLFSVNIHLLIFAY